MNRLLLASLFAVAAGSIAAQAEQMTGYISEAHCGIAHSSVSEKNTACIKKCIGGGSQPVLVSEGKVIKFDAASQQKALAHVGEDVQIDGSMSGDAVTISSIEKK
jgi:hypothetical protein